MLVDEDNNKEIKYIQIISNGGENYREKLSRGDG